MTRASLPDFITATAAAGDAKGQGRALAISAADIIHIDPTHGHLGIAHALAKAGYMLSDDYHRFFGDGENNEPTIA